jgi:hypothetical protein
MVVSLATQSGSATLRRWHFWSFRSLHADIPRSILWRRRCQLYLAKRLIRDEIMLLTWKAIPDKHV